MLLNLITYAKSDEFLRLKGCNDPPIFNMVRLIKDKSWREFSYRWLSGADRYGGF